jgi:hypothetical protein
MTSWIFFTSQGDFEFYAGAAFASVIASTADLNGGVIDSIVPRGFAYDNCERLPCTYEVPGLYGRAGFRLSVSLFLPYFYFRMGNCGDVVFFYVKVEATVRFKHVLPLCDPWCDPTQYWWCIPCTGVYAQTILTIGGCAPYQTTSHCGGAVSFFLWSSTRAIRLTSCLFIILTALDLGHRRRRGSLRYVYFNHHTGN